MENCPICYRDLDNLTAVLKSCKHQFCLSCFRKWIIINPTCPLDRDPITTINIYEKDKRVTKISILHLLRDFIDKKIGECKILINNARLLITEQYNFLTLLKIVFSKRKSIPIILEKSRKFSKEKLEKYSKLINKSISNEINFLVKTKIKTNINYEKTCESCVELSNKVTEIKTINSRHFPELKRAKRSLQYLSYGMEETNFISKKCIKKFSDMIKMYEQNNMYLKRILRNKNSECFKEHLKKIKIVSFILNNILEENII